MPFKNTSWTMAAVFLAVALSIPSSASAFCGFYVGGGGADIFNDATQVVLMREGTQTVLSMQNRYSGPPASFAMVVPVPVVLQEENVKTLSPDIFAKIDTLTSPRLVEYWEQDPCQQDYWDDEFAASPSAADGANNSTNTSNNTVTVEAEFAVGEYTIKILSATEANGLETWLVDNDYNVPTGAAPYYEPYINSGMYFFVAEVDPSKVTFDGNGNAILSPIRFDYDSPDFQLPVRLGMINSNGQQDLITYILGKNQRYELANYPNAFVPTNIEVVDAVRNNFGAFYRQLFARTLKENPNHAITEYSWNAAGCDPCPGPVQLQPDDIATLGGDVINAGGEDGYWGWVVTRIHMRYDQNEVGEDLIFKEADPVAGGRERYDEDGNLEKGAFPDHMNNFQARFIIRHRWTKPVDCVDPVFERWGGDPDNGGGDFPSISSAQSPNTTGEDVFAAPSTDSTVEELVREDIPAINVVAAAGEKPGTGCSAANAESAVPGGLLALFGIFGIFGIRIRRRRR